MEKIRKTVFILTLVFMNLSLASKSKEVIEQNLENQQEKLGHALLNKQAYNQESEDPFFMVDAHGLTIGGVLQPFSSYSHTLDSFDDKTLIAENPTSNPVPEGLSWNQEMTKLFGVSVTSDTSSPILITINPSDGIATIVAEFSGLGDNQTIQGIAIDENNACYIIATDNMNHATSSFLYECNLDTAQLTLIGSQDVAPDIHDITASCDGILYGTDSTKGELFSIDKDNGNATIIGSLGYGNRAFFSMTYDRGTDTIYQYVLHSSGYQTAFSKVDKTTGVATPISQYYNYGRFIGANKSSCPNQVNSFKLNPGFNGSWYNSETVGQGFMLDVFPESNVFFAAWFTFVNSSETGESSSIGSPEHRWFTAQGELGDDNILELTIYNTSGGIFNDPKSVQSDAIGTMTMSFEDCSTGIVEFAFDGIQLSGTIPITRIANDNVALCESLLNAGE